jgi:CPA2 family monovalent cation:H+ antiporter-2
VPAPGTILADLAVVLCVAAVTTVLFRWLRQPVVLGYLLAGLIVGPYVPIPLFADVERVHMLSELGVILVMFSIGLDFSLRRLARVLPKAGLVGVIQISSLVWLGYLAAQALGWTSLESIFTGAIVAISSTMVLAKIFAEQRIEGRLAELVFGVLIVEDLAAVLLLALLATLSVGAGDPGGALMSSAAGLLAFLVALVVVGFLVVPRTIRLVARLGSPETLLVTSVAICFALALTAQGVGYPVALGAFLAGSLVAESGEAEQVERLTRPIRDIFAAVFFVAIGMLVDPAAIPRNWSPVALLLAVVVLGKTFSVFLGALLSGYDVRTSLRSGMSLAQIGEFSFILAALGIASGATRSSLLPVVVAVSVVTTFATPWLVRASEPLALFVDRRLPKPMQTFVSLYASWLERLRARPRRTAGAGVRRLVKLLLADSVLLAAIVIGGSLGIGWVVGFLEARFRIPPLAGWWLAVAGGLGAALPFAIGIIRCARALGARLAAIALPPAPDGRLDLAAVPRRALVVTIQLAIVLLVGAPLLALTQPFVPAPYGVAIIGAALVLLGVTFWRRTTDLQEHVKAGAQLILEKLSTQAAGPRRTTGLEDIERLLPGLSPITTLRIDAHNPAVGKTLSQLNLRGLTGASVIAIRRGGSGVLVPTGHEPLRAGDLLALAGTHEAIEAAKDVLCPAPRPEAKRREVPPS